MAQASPLHLFISYSHKDDICRQDLEAHLSPLKRQGILDVWSDQAIEAGEEWEQSISEKLEAADIILLLVSPDFLASEFISEKELKRAMDRHEAGQTRVIPVFLRPCHWKGEVFGKLQGVPDDAKPVSRWEDRDEAFACIAEAISKTAEVLARDIAKRKAEKAWDEAVRIHTVEAYRAYLEVYPQGEHAPEAAFNLGLMYAEGDGVPQDYAEAVRWYRKAAEQDYAPAQFNLGRMSETGRGVPKNYAQAVQWYRKAAEQGYAVGQRGLGWMYQNGFGVPQDDALAVQWYRKAAEQGEVNAQNNLGVMYRDGCGVAQDEAQAVQWYRKAAEQGCARAQFNLGVMYTEGAGVLRDYAEAVRWYRKAAEQSCARAQCNLGRMYATGRGVVQDEAQAVRWYRKAAEQGYARAQVHLGRMYAAGRGVPQDDAEAMHWYRKAAEQGDVEVREELQALCAHGVLHQRSRHLASQAGARR